MAAAKRESRERLLIQSIGNNKNRENSLEGRGEKTEKIMGRRRFRYFGCSIPSETLIISVLKRLKSETINQNVEAVRFLKAN